MREAHQDFIERWANYVKTNPNWKKEQTKFINAQIEKANKILSKLPKEKLSKLKLY
jgi:hypothetical protein